MKIKQNLQVPNWPLTYSYITVTDNLKQVTKVRRCYFPTISSVVLQLLWLLNGMRTALFPVIGRVFDCVVSCVCDLVVSG